jgi:hypothetical protein
MPFSATRDQGPKAKRLLAITQPLQLRPPNEVSYAQRRHMVESLRTVARYVRWLCIGQLGVHQVVKERWALAPSQGVACCDGFNLALR